MVVEERGPATCARCEGRGWLVEEDGGAGAARPCDCQAAGLVPRLVEQAAIPPRYRNFTLDNFKAYLPAGAQRDQLVAARSVSRRYVDRFIDESGAFAETGLLFIGPSGVGKTHLAVAILIELVRRYRARGRFADFTTLIHRIQSTFDPGSPESKHAILDPVTEAEVLVLDELGAQKPTPWVMEILYLIINARYTRRLPTLFTTNYRLEPGDSGAVARSVGEAPLLRERISASLLSRLYEMARPVVMEVDDFRRVMKVHRHSA